MTKVVAGNWKMHLGPEGAANLMGELAGGPPHERARLMVFPPAVSLHRCRELAPPHVEIGVQNIHPEPSGAFTGETSAEMAKEAGATAALVGHSERRHVFGETDAETAAKVAAALRAGLLPVVCVGETLEERRSGRLSEVLARQLEAVLAALAQTPSFMIAYEPVWAIGTGETATPEDATAAHAIVRDTLGERRGAPVLYGGSVKPGNAAALMQAPGVDGVLVGGASLDAASFLAIAAAARKAAGSG